MGNEYQRDQSQQDQYGNTNQSGMPQQDQYGNQPDQTGMQQDQSGRQQDQYGNQPDQTGMQQDQYGNQQGQMDQSGNQQNAGPVGDAERMAQQQVDQGIDNLGNKIPGGQRFTGQAKDMASKGMDDLENEAERRGRDMFGGTGGGGGQ